MSLSAIDALKRLQEGNKRFVDESENPSTATNKVLRSELVESQSPFAVILGCSDSRVPTEIIFDQGLGDLFVIRVAGNVIAPSLVGSVEYAVQHLGTRLVVVLGHSNCGAVTATLDNLAPSATTGSPNLDSIVDRIRPAVEELVHTDLHGDRTQLLHHAVRANVRASAGQLRTGSHLIEQLAQTDGLLVVGATYSLDSGVVEFFDGMPS